jgi:tight adherence protein B
MGATTHLLLGWGAVSLLGAGVGASAPFAYYIHRHDVRRADLQRSLADAIGQLRDAIRTGLSVQESLVGLARSGPETLRPEFATLVREIRLLGFEPALTAMRERLADPVFDVVAASLLLNDRLGGRNVSQVLDRLAHATRAQLRVQEEMRAYQARNVLSARVIAAVPLVVLIGVRNVNPQYLAMFNDWSGQMLLAGCVASVALGYAAMLWVARLPDEPRVLQ